jgi:ectoine hydroxylase-related dioxygenase (phytanoyl-CoA dioxygenase family)
MSAQPSTASALAAAYERDGFVFPIDVMSRAEAEALRGDLEAAEAECAADPQRLSLLRSYPDRLLPAFDTLIRKPTLLEPVSEILGPDLMVWSAGLFMKDARSESFVTWHQDLTYWGLDQTQEVTAWVALSPATPESGCMRFLPGSHHHRQVAHRDSFAPGNLLTRGQAVDVEVDDAEGVDVVLQTGQASLHHGHLFHASAPNRSDDRRIGVAVRYITPDMKQVTGDRSLVALVRGADRHGHFTVAAPPLRRLATEDFERCRVDSEIKARVLYRGADEEGGQRYR